MTYNDIINDLRQELELLNDINEYKKFLQSISFNLDISIFSLLYLLKQRKELTSIGTKKMWENINRSIKDNEKPIYNIYFDEKQNLVTQEVFDFTQTVKNNKGRDNTLDIDFTFINNFIKNKYRNNDSFDINFQKYIEDKIRDVNVFFRKNVEFAVYSRFNIENNVVINNNFLLLLNDRNKKINFLCDIKDEISSVIKEILLEFNKFSNTLEGNKNISNSKEKKHEQQYDNKLESNERRNETKQIHDKVLRRNDKEGQVVYDRRFKRHIIRFKQSNSINGFTIISRTVRDEKKGNKPSIYQLRFSESREYNENNKHDDRSRSNAKDSFASDKKYNRINFYNSGDTLVFGNNEEKYQQNIEAIKLVKLLDRENRFPDKEEQNILSNYNGWGGLSFVFDRTNHKEKYNELSTLLTKEEFNSAKESCLTSFYTPLDIIKYIYDSILPYFNFNKDRRLNVLDPSMGIGNFFSVLENSDEFYNLTGVEIDSISASISRYLYPNANILEKGYEDVDILNNSFDLAISNVPFGNYTIYDDNNDKNYNIHDYFFIKTLEKLKPNGIMAFITSSGTLDKRNFEIRKYICERAILKGAIRFPNNTFSTSGTGVVSDLIILQKRDHIKNIELNALQSSDKWIETDLIDNINLNSYFIKHDDMLLGNLVKTTNQYGENIFDVRDYKDKKEREEKRKRAFNLLKLNQEYFVERDNKNITPSEYISLKNITPYTYFIKDEKLYYSKNNHAELIDLDFSNKKDLKKFNIIKGFIDIKEKVLKVMNVQKQKPFNILKYEYHLKKLNNTYDNFVSKYGFLTENINLINDDISYSIIYALEISKVDNNDKIIYGKSNIFFEPTIINNKDKNIKNINDAIALSLSQKGKIDIKYMQDLLGYDDKRLEEELEDRVFHNHFNLNERILSSEYLSGDVKSKLEDVNKLIELNEYNAKHFGENEISKRELFLLKKNKKALEEVIPEDIPFSDIGINLGSTWIDINIYKKFLNEVFKIDRYSITDIDYNTKLNEYIILNKNAYYDIEIENKFGTDRISSLKLLEKTMNMRDIKIYDTIENIEGEKKRVFNAEETAKAKIKQRELKQEFLSWVISKPEIRESLQENYNEVINRYVVRKYDENLYINPDGISNKIELTKQQKKGVLRILLSKDNTLLPYKVGSGKTFTMIAGSMALKQAGLCNKPLFVVPKHLIGQWGNDFYRLYPNANLLIPNEKDMNRKNRQKFISKISTGNYDAVIMSYTQFESIKMSDEYIKKVYEKEIIDFELFLETQDSSQRSTVKKIQRQIKTLKEQYRKIQLQIQKHQDDSLLYFEDLGIDYLFIDEAHYYKNCYFKTKLSGISGLSVTNSKKSFDFYMKTRYITEQNKNHKGLVFATATPVTNSIAEIYIMQKYLQYDTLQKSNIAFFDEWASTFCEVSSNIELSVSAQSYTTRTRFSKFKNLPELLRIFHMVADYQEDVEEIKGLPKLQDDKIKTISVEPSELAKKYMKQFEERNQNIYSGIIDRRDDNMLKLTNDGRKLSIDTTLLHGIEQPRENSKVFACCDEVLKIYNKTKNNKGFQMVFLDYGVPLYEKMKNDLVIHGASSKEIAIINYYNSKKQKEELFQKCRSGDIRILIGSTEKMGKGTNVQERMVALHHLDCPWRPSDITQRNGRILRQGNINKIVNISRYITKGTFDAYMWQIQENKNKFIQQMETNNPLLRECEDIDGIVLDCAEVKALCCDNPIIKEKFKIDNEIQVLELEKREFLKRIDNAYITKKNTEEKVKELTRIINRYKLDIESLADYQDNNDFSIILNGEIYYERKKAGEILNHIVTNVNPNNFNKVEIIGKYKSFNISVFRFNNNDSSVDYKLALENNSYNVIEFREGQFLGNIIKIENGVKRLPKKFDDFKQEKLVLENEINKIDNIISNHKWDKESELNKLYFKKNKIEYELNISNKHDYSNKDKNELDIELV